jgi:hypothetical protein
MNTAFDQAEEASNMSAPAATVGAITAKAAASHGLRGTICTLGIGLILTLSSGLNPAQAHAVCGGNSPCFDSIDMEGPTTLEARWHRPDSQLFFDYYNFQYNSTVDPEWRLNEGPTIIRGVQPGVTYTLMVQSCGRAIFNPSSSEASLGPPRWVARVGWDRRGWLLVEERSEPALRGFAARPRGWALVRTGLTDQACGHGCGGDGKRCA